MIRHILSIAVVFGSCTCALASDATTGNAFRTTVAGEDVDYEATQTYYNGESKLVSRRILTALLDKQQGSWKAGDTGGKWVEERSYSYRLAFHRAVSIGSMSVQLATSHPAEQANFFALRSDAPYPGDITNPDHWLELWSRFEHGRFQVIAPAKMTTRAIYCTHAIRYGQSAITRLEIHNSRLVNVTPLGVAQAEWKAGGTAPAELTSGKTWFNVGTYSEDGIPWRGPVTEVEPAWIILNLDTTHAPCAVRMRGSVGKLRLYQYVGDDVTNPALADKDMWRRVSLQDEQYVRPFQQSPMHLLSFTPRKTRALKLMLDSSTESSKEQVRVYELSVLTDLGEAEIPEFAEERPSPPPAGFDYELEEDVEVAIVIEGPDGKRIRNLVAQVPRTGGNNFEQWDLKDERGHMVPPGRYRWHGIHAPPLQLLYRHTPYPNVEMHAPGNLPWNYRTQDGWLANHTNHTAVCAVGDKLFVGTGGTEGGHSSLMANLKGQKERGFGWAAHQHGMFTNGDDLFVWTGGGINRFDKEKNRLSSLFSIPRTDDRRGRVRGRAARGDRIYINYYDTIGYFSLATNFSNVDLKANYPQLRESVKTKEFYGIKTTPRKDFAGLFRLGEFIPGIIAPEGITHIPSTFGSHPTQFAVLVFKQPVPLGSLIFPNLDDPEIGLAISVLKPDMPPLPGKSDYWQPIWDSGQGVITTQSKRALDPGTKAFKPWQCIPAHPGTMTRAIRLTFIDTDRDVGLAFSDRTVDDGRAPSLDDANSNDLFDTEKKARSILEGGDSWRAKLGGMRLLRRRFENVEPDAIRVNSGAVDAETGIWDARRDRILQPDDPGIYVMEWNDPQTLRGLGIKEIGGATTHIDMYVGEASEIDINSEEGWKQIATHKQAVRSGAHNSTRNNARAVYLDSCVDFGHEVTTRAIRLRIVEAQIGALTPDRVAIRGQARRCKVFGVSPLRYIGGESPVEGQIMVQRLETRSATSGELLHEVVAELNGDIAVSPEGDLYGVAGREIVKVDPQTGEASDAGVPDHHIPGVMEFDSKGSLYVFDYDRPRSNIRVYTPKDDGGFDFSHTVGDPGIAGPGLRNPAQLDDATSFSIDEEDNLWAVYPHVWPKRVSHFKTDGTFVKEMLGNTQYGGGGTMDRYDKSRVYYKDMEFEVDVDGGRSRIKAFNTRIHQYTNPWYTHKFRDDLTAVMIDGRRYLVTTPLSQMQFRPAGWVHLMDEDTREMKLVAGAGSPTASDFFRTPEFLEHLDGKNLGHLNFIWADRNGDQRPQPDEVTFTESKGATYVGRFSLDLSLPTNKGYYRVKEFFRDGVPLFEEVRMGPEGGGVVRFSDGSFLQMGYKATTSGGGWNRAIDEDGKELWRYPAWCGVSGLWIAPWAPGYAPNQLVVAGHETAPKGDLGEFVVISANTGQLNIWTRDGLLAGQVCYHTRNPERSFFPGSNKSGTRMDRYSQGQEHFHAFFTRTEDDDRYFIVTGGNHISIVEVAGLEKFKRFEGEIQVTPEMIHKTREWDESREKKRNFVVAQAADCYLIKRRPRIDGSIGEKEWPPASTSISREVTAKLNMGYDGAYLYVGFNVTGAGPLKNTGDDFRRVFKTGGGVDIRLGTSPTSDPDRAEPAAGDIRLVLTYRNGKPAAVLYRPVSPDAAADAAWSTSTPAGGTTSFEEVTMLSGIRIARTGSSNAYSLEAAIPLRLLGMTPEPGLLLKMDWGVISTDVGMHNVGRNYWADRTAVGSTDEPTEARMMPALWGHIRFRGSNDESLPQLTDANPGSLLRDRRPDAALTEFLEELKEQ